MSEWTREIAGKALHKLATERRGPGRERREKEYFLLRAHHIKGLFGQVEAFVADVNREASRTVIKMEKDLHPKNLGGIEVPDNARLVLKFVDRRVEFVINALAQVAGQPAPLGGVATGSVIQYDPNDPEGADWFDIFLSENGQWQRKGTEKKGKGYSPFAEKGLKLLIEWLVS